jgi:hypothetical protein
VKLAALDTVPGWARRLLARVGVPVEALITVAEAVPPSYVAALGELVDVGGAVAAGAVAGPPEPPAAFWSVYEAEGARLGVSAELIAALATVDHMVHGRGWTEASRHALHEAAPTLGEAMRDGRGLAGALAGRETGPVGLALLLGVFGWWVLRRAPVGAGDVAPLVTWFESVSGDVSTRGDHAVV